MIAVRTTGLIAASVLLLAACGSGQVGSSDTSAVTSPTPATALPPTGTTSQTPATALPPTGTTSQTPAPSPTDTAAQPASSAARAVPTALRFTAKTLDGQNFDGQSLAGKPVVFWFWAPWCPKCRAEAPNVKAAAAAYRDVLFVGIASLDAEAAMKEFVQQTSTGGITHLSDEKGEVWAKLGIASQSTFLFMKPDGSTTKATGPLGAVELNALVVKLRAG